MLDRCSDERGALLPMNRVAGVLDDMAGKQGRGARKEVKGREKKLHGAP